MFSPPNTVRSGSHELIRIRSQTRAARLYYNVAYLSVEDFFAPLRGLRSSSRRDDEWCWPCSTFGLVGESGGGPCRVGHERTTSDRRKRGASCGDRGQNLSSCSHALLVESACDVRHVSPPQLVVELASLGLSFLFVEVPGVRCAHAAVPVSRYLPVPEAVILGIGTFLEQPTCE